MKGIVTTDRERVGTWVAEKVGREVPWTRDAAIGVVRDGVLVGGVVIDGILPGVRAAMHCAGADKHWLSRDVLFSFFDYAFRQLKLKVVVAPIASGNERAQEFVKKVGFEYSGCIPKGWDDGVQDLIFYTMRHEQCRWLNYAGVPHAI